MRVFNPNLLLQIVSHAEFPRESAEMWYLDFADLFGRLLWSAFSEASSVLRLCRSGSLTMENLRACVVLGRTWPRGLTPGLGCQGGVRVPRAL